MEHRGSSFINSCVKVPVDPYSRQPTPSYERPTVDRISKRSDSYRNRKINFASPSFNDNTNRTDIGSSDESNLDSFIDFIESIPDYGQVHHLSNEQFKQKLDYLKRKQRLLLKNLNNCLNDTKQNDYDEKSQNIMSEKSVLTPNIHGDKLKSKTWDSRHGDLKLLGKKCHLEDSRTDSPIIFSYGNFASLAEDQDLLTYRCKENEKSLKTARNGELYSTIAKSWSTWSGSKSSASDKSSSENSIETRSLPPNSPRRWPSGGSKSFANSRNDDEKYMNQNMEKFHEDNKTKESVKKKHFRPVPLTSRIPLYDKLVAAKEERSRMIREESAWSLMSQVKPFRLECDRRAVRAMTRSTPELTTKLFRAPSRFKAKPVPANLFGTEIYDRMLEDEYCRQLQKKIRAAELMKSSSLPPSMAKRERIKSANIPRAKTFSNYECQRSEESYRMYNSTPLNSERSRSAMTDVSLRGNNLAAILRCQASRKKLEDEIQKKIEEQLRERSIKMRESVTSRKPAWRALRHAAKKEHARDLDYRASLRRDESREQAERHRLEMELMLNRVTQIPTLFERYSQSFQAMRQLQSARVYNLERRKKKRKSKFPISSSASVADSRSDSGTLTNTSKSSDSTKSHRSNIISDSPTGKIKKNERGPLRVSINETAELIEDNIMNDERSLSNHSSDNDEVQVS